MNQPPPHGWHQQQGWPQQPGPPQPGPQQQPGQQHPGAPQPAPQHPGAAQPGAHHLGPQQPGQQGWQHQPGHPPQPGWGPPQPPRKSKAPLVVGILAGVLVLAGAITALVLYLDANADSGTEKRADKLPAVCGNVSEAALAQARTTNPNGRASRETKVPKGTNTICSWNQTKGVDGSGQRSTDVTVHAEREEVETAFNRAVSMNMANKQGTPLQKPIEGLGDEAVVVLVETNSAFTELAVIVRTGDYLVEVDISGWDAGLFSNTKPDPAELEAAAKGIAQDMAGKL